LSAAIAEGRLAPGVLYSVQTLAVQLGVSRTPVREAMLQLVRLGMVRAVRNRGFEIVETTGHDLEDIFEIRALLEVAAVRRAVGRMSVAAKVQLRKEYNLLMAAAEHDDENALWGHDRAFHRLLLEASGNQRLAQYVDGLRGLVLVRGKRTTHGQRSLRQVALEHRPILAAVEKRNAQAAADAMHAHVTHTARLLTALEARDVARSAGK
jgi:DNA-binding GntR family transcriptional regulator